MFFKGKTLGAKLRAAEEARYEKVALEIDNGIIKEGLWAKAVSQSGDAESSVRGIYIKLRVQSLIDEEHLLAEESKKRLPADREEQKERERLRRHEHNQRENERLSALRESSEGNPKISEDQSSLYFWMFMVAPILFLLFLIMAAVVN